MTPITQSFTKSKISHSKLMLKPKRESKSSNMTLHHQSFLIYGITTMDYWKEMMTISEDASFI